MIDEKEGRITFVPRENCKIDFSIQYRDIDRLVKMLNQLKSNIYIDYHMDIIKEQV